MMLDFVLFSARISWMKYVHILADAWNLTTATKKLTWFVFAPSVAFILMFIGEVAWQYSMFGEEFGWIEEGATFGLIGQSFLAVRDSGMLWLVITMTILGALLLFVLEPWIHATLILGIQQRFETPQKRLSLRRKIFEGHQHFVHLLEYHALLTPFSLLSIVFYGVSFYRYTHGGDNFYELFLPFLIIMAILSLFIHFFLVFMPFYLVCEKEEFFKSLTKSFGLVFMNLGKTLSLFLVMILVSLRVIVNVLVVIGVPLGLVSIATYFATSNFYTVFLSLAGILSLILVCGAGYLTAILEVFATSFWFRAFQVFRIAGDEEIAEEESPKKDLALITKEEAPKEQMVKVVHVVHHVQPGAPMPKPEDFKDIEGQVTEIKEDGLPDGKDESRG